jgi:hypothetical protein
MASKKSRKVKAAALRTKEKQKASGKTAYSSLKDKAKNDPLVTFTSMLNSAKCRATAASRSFSITNKDICYLWIKQQGKCALTGNDLTTELGSKDLFLASIDRIDSNFGYTEDNIQLVGAAVNCMKSNHTQQQFVEICKLVAKVHQ